MDRRAHAVRSAASDPLSGPTDKYLGRIHAAADPAIPTNSGMPPIISAVQSPGYSAAPAPSPAASSSAADGLLFRAPSFGLVLSLVIAPSLAAVFMRCWQR